MPELGHRKSLLVALADEAGPIFYGDAHESTMNVVEFLMIGPIGLDIINLKTDVRRHPVAL